jgi:GNAT superfamily N-acetyltransferase
MQTRKDIFQAIADPNWQHKRVGTAPMQTISNWRDTNGGEKALAGLYTGESLAAFYSRFGFAPAFSMSRRIHRERE